MENDSINNMVDALMNPGVNITKDETGFLQFTDGLTESKVLEKTRKFEAQWKRFDTTYQRNLQNCYNAYRNQNISAEGVSVKVPEIFALIETELPHLLNALFGQSTIIDAKAKFNDPEEVRTYKMKAYINNLIKNTCDGEKKTNQIIKNELIYGTSIIKVFWDETVDEDINPLNGMITPINSSHPNFDLVDPFTFAWDTRNESQDLGECQWLRERIFLSKEKMKVLRDSGKCAEFSDDDMTSTQNKGRMKRQKETGDAVGEEDSTYYDEYSATLYSEDEDGRTTESEYIIWVLAENKVIKFHPNKMQRKMYCICRAYDSPNELMGMGEPDVIGALASHASYIHFQLGKTIKRVGQSMVLLTPDANMSSEELRAVEDGVYFVDNKEGLSFQDTIDPMNVKVLIESKQYIDEQISSVTGIGPALQGESIGDVTATEASYVFQNASNRLALKLTSLQNDFMKNLAQMLFALAKQTLQEPVSFFDTNNNNINLTPADFLGNYEWKCDGSISQANKALQLAQNSQLAQQMVQLVQMSQQSSKPLDFNGQEILQGLIGPFTNSPDLSRYVFLKVIPPPPPPQPAPQFPGSRGAVTVQPNAGGPIQNAGLSPLGISKLPVASQLNPEAQIAPHMPHLGKKSGAALRTV